MAKKKYAIIIHGGAGVLDKDAPRETVLMWRDALDAAMQAGLKKLQAGLTAVEAVEAAINYMEDNPIFNAGKGAVFSNAGENELDASIMRGQDAGCGAVAGLKTVKNPISLARKVMENSNHVFMISRGAEQFAEEQGFEPMPKEYFHTEHRYKQWLSCRDSQYVDAIADCSVVDSSVVDGVGKKKGTVGAVALDQFGNLAAGTSTGGLTNKRYGRVGDTCVIGAGTFACNDTCGVSCTGNGEEFIRYGVARDVHAMMLYAGMSVEQAAYEVIMNKKLQPDDGGLIAIDKDGNITAACNADVLFRASADSEGLHEVKIWEPDYDHGW